MQQTNVTEINVPTDEQDASVTVKEIVYEKPLSYLEWVGSVFLLSIPFVNIISSIAFIFLRRKSKNRSNYVIASLMISFSFLILIAIILFIFRDYLKDVVLDIYRQMP